jgi:hypothetical protein
MSSEEERKRKERNSVTLTDFDIKTKLSILEGMLAETLYAIDVFTKRIERLERRYLRRVKERSEDSVILLLVILILLGSQGLRLPEDRIRRALEECRNSKEPDRCVENAVKGG